MATTLHRPGSAQPRRQRGVGLVETMVGIVIAFPSLVTATLQRDKVDPSKMELKIPSPEDDSAHGSGADKDQSGSNDAADIEKMFKHPDASKPGAGSEKDKNKEGNEASDLQNMFKQK